MAAKKSKSDEKIYDYFKTEPIVLNGRFARYADAMWTRIRLMKNQNLRNCWIFMRQQRLSAFEKEAG